MLLQVLLTAPGAQGSAGQNAEPYAAAQRWLDGFMARTVNGPLPAGAAAASGAEGMAAAARSAGVPWTVPPHKPPSGA